MDERFLASLQIDLKQLAEEMIPIMGEWKGDETGAGEIRADIAAQIRNQARYLDSLLETLNQTKQ